MDEQALTLLLAQGLSVERIAKRYGKHPSTVYYWMEKYGLTAVNHDKHAAKGGIDRDRLVALVESGKSIGQISIAVGRSKGTVRHWLRRYGLRTRHRPKRSSRPEALASKEAGLLTASMVCPRHGEAEFLLEGRGYYRCKRCRVEAAARRRRRVKEILIQEAGGGCLICGYCRCSAALTFHHLDPTQKRLEVNAKGVALSLEKLRAEAKKCVLLCANCHAEVENGVAVVPGAALAVQYGRVVPPGQRAQGRNAA